jgi:hypothetical protein
MVTNSSPLCQGQVIGLCAGPSGRLVCSVAGDGVSVVDVASSRTVRFHPFVPTNALHASSSLPRSFARSRVRVFACSPVD